MTDKHCLKRSITDGTDGKDPCRATQEGKLTKLSSSTAYAKNVSNDNLTVSRNSDHYCGFSAENSFEMYSSDMIPFHSQLESQHEQTSVPEHSVTSNYYKCATTSQHRNIVSPLHSQMSTLQGNTEHQNIVYVTPSTPKHTQVNRHMSPWFAMPSTLHIQDQPSNRDNCLPDQVRYMHQSLLSLDSVSMLKQNPKLVSSYNINQTCPLPVCMKREDQNTQSSVGSCVQDIKREDQNTQSSVGSCIQDIKREDQNTQSSVGSCIQDRKREDQNTQSSVGSCVQDIKREDQNTQSSVGSCIQDIKREDQNTQSSVGSCIQDIKREDQNTQSSVGNCVQDIKRKYQNTQSSVGSCVQDIKREYQNTQSSVGSCVQDIKREDQNTQSSVGSCVQDIKREDQNTQSSVGSCVQDIKKGKQSYPESGRWTHNMNREGSSYVGPLLNNFVSSKSVSDICWQNLNVMNVYSGITKRNSILPLSFSHLETEKVDFCTQKHGNSKLQWQNNHDLYQSIKQESFDINFSQESIINQRQNIARPVKVMKKEQVEPVSSQTSVAVSKSNLETSHGVQQLITTNTSSGASSSLQGQNPIETRSLHETCMSLQRGIFKFIPRFVPLSIADAYLLVEKVQCEELGRVRTPRLAVYAYNPLEYAFDVHFKFVQRFCNTEKEILFLGMNPGPWGMSQNGVPFGEARVVREWMQLSGNVLKPDPENPKRPVTGLECTRSEVSGARFWNLFQGLCGTPENFFRTSFVYNMCPLSFMSVTGKNITPPQIEAQIRKEINSICDRALLQVVKLLKVKTIVAVGRYAHDRALGILKQAGNITVRLETMMHPSPINPAANRGWEEKVKDQLLAFNLLETIQG